MTAQRARLDADRTAKPKTILTTIPRGSREGTWYLGPAVFYVDTETGRRVALYDQDHSAATS